MNEDKRTSIEIEHLLSDESTGIETNRIDRIMSRLGFGRFQYLLMTAISIIAFVDGADVTLISLLAYILKSEWGLSSTEISLLSGSFLVGMAFGFFAGGQLEDRLGRIAIIKVSLFCKLLFGIASVFMVELWGLSLLRMFSGFAIGFSVPSLITLAAEMCPMEQRGRYILVIELFFGVGQLCVVLLSKLLIPELAGDNWRLLILFIALPLIPAMIMVYSYFLESPLFLARNLRYEDSVNNLNIMAKYNEQPGLFLEETNEVYMVTPGLLKAGKNKYGLLFNKTHFSTSMKMLGLWIMLLFTFYGLCIVLPFTLEVEDDEPEAIVDGMIFVITLQIPGILLAIYVIEKKFFGRNTSIVIFTAALALMSSLVIVIENSIVLYLTLSLILSLAYAALCLLFPYTAEIYETQVRLASLGFFNLISRLFSAATIQVIFILYDIDPDLPFLLFGILSALSSVLTLTLPFDTTGVPLDAQEF